MQGRRAASVPLGERLPADSAKALLCKALRLEMEEVAEVSVCVVSVVSKLPAELYFSSSGISSLQNFQLCKQVMFLRINLKKEVMLDEKKDGQ